MAGGAACLGQDLSPEIHLKPPGKTCVPALNVVFYHRGPHPTEHTPPGPSWILPEPVCRSAGARLLPCSQPDSSPAMSPSPSHARRRQQHNPPWGHAAHATPGSVRWQTGSGWGARRVGTKHGSSHEHFPTAYPGRGAGWGGGVSGEGSRWTRRGDTSPGGGDGHGSIVLRLFPSAPAPVKTQRYASPRLQSSRSANLPEGRARGPPSYPRAGGPAAGRA